jgi:hypothetical protein
MNALLARIAAMSGQGDRQHRARASMNPRSITRLEPTMVMRVFAGLVLAGVLGAGPMVAVHAVQAAEVQERQVQSLAGLPAELRAQVLASASGEMSDRGGPFNPGCVVQAGVPNARFVSAVLRGDQAVVKVEQGGIAHYVRTLEFQRADGGWKLAPQKAG